VHQTIKSGTPAQTVPPAAEYLCVDMDGTLLEGDSLWESLLALLGTHPWYVFFLPIWLLRGKAALKHAIAERARMDVRTLPLREDVVEFLRQEKEKGRKLILATAADLIIAEAVAERVELFDTVLASDGKTNLSGGNKRKAIQEFLGAKDFDYAGDSSADIPVWKASRAAILVGPTPGLLEIVQRTVPVGQVFPRRRFRWASLVRALRPKHWVKNLLVFVPLVLAHKLRNVHLFTEALLAFVTFSLCASGGYVLNDLFDLEADRLHATKRSRPWASGQIPLWLGMVIAPLLMTAGWAIAASLSRLFLMEAIIYVAATVLYSAYIKRVPMVDVLVLTGLYLVRILGGGAATGIPVTPWLLAFSMFLLLSLAFAKRYMELVGQTPKSGEPSGLSKRNYIPADGDLVRQFGISSGYISVLVLALYVNDAEVTVLYRRPQWIWLACPLLLFWISRVWFLSSRGVLHEDPVVFAVRDGISYLLGLIILLIIFVAS
jgi:4-hydroxybenzoate polyprenyltransferase/phosphoserine phosphatase